MHDPQQPLRVFVGYDPAEDLAFQVCRRSMRESLSAPRTPGVLIEPICLAALRTAGLYRRPFYVDDGQAHDAIDGKPFSTEFAFTRFLVPALCQWSGWALFCDCDFLWRADVRDLFDLKNDGYAAMVVKHRHVPAEQRKMRDGQVQTRYDRKNWSSLVLWNCGHPANRGLTPFMVNTQPGWWLHGFRWLADVLIGEVPMGWNWLEGYSSPDINPMAIHYTRGTPDVDGHQNAAHASDWLDYARIVREAA